MTGLSVACHMYRQSSTQAHRVALAPIASFQLDCVGEQPALPLRWSAIGVIVAAKAVTDVPAQPLKCRCWTRRGKT